MRLRLVLLDRLDETVDDAARVDDRQLRKEKAELLVVGPGQFRLHVRLEVPEPFLERA